MKKEKDNLMTSIVLCTYNGVKYLKEQLDSILEQTILPDEMIICDDGSVDVTLEIIEEFKKEVKFKVDIYHNEKTLGSTKNFEKAIKLCNGDIIVLCDQDDIWFPKKIEEIKKTFIEFPNAGYIFSNGLIFDEQLPYLNINLWDRFLFTEKQKIKFNKSSLKQLEILLTHNIVTGATMAINNKIIDLVLPIPEDWIHDDWISLFSSAIGYKGIPINKNLIKYRIHKKQLCGIGDYNANRLINSIKKAVNSNSASYNKRAEQLFKIIRHLESKNLLEQEVKKILEDGIEHLKTRQCIHKHSRLKRHCFIFKEILKGHYHKYANGWKSIAKDCFMNWNK